ncbi:MAG TPA: YIP1 family protein [Longimicrobium sp.]
MSLEEGAARSLARRMAGAARLEVAAYDEVRRDESATPQAVLVVAIVAVAQAIGAAGEGGPGVVGGLVPAFAGWILWSGVAYLIGARLLGKTVTWGELLRTLGFAQTPSILGVLGIVPGMSALVGVVLGVWLLITGVVAMRLVLGVSTGRAIAISVAAWIIAHIPMVIAYEMVG